MIHKQIFSIPPTRVIEGVEEEEDRQNIFGRMWGTSPLVGLNDRSKSANNLSLLLLSLSAINS